MADAPVRDSGVISERSSRSNPDEDLLDVSERLVVQLGLGALADRSVSVGPGAGSRPEAGPPLFRRRLVQDVLDRHAAGLCAQLEVQRKRRSEEDGPRAAVAVSVRALTSHLAELGPACSFARFLEQVLRVPNADGVFAASPGFAEWLHGLGEALLTINPDIAPEVLAVRFLAARLAVVSTCASYERFAAGSGAATDWDFVGEALTDMLLGMFQAPSQI